MAPPTPVFLCGPTASGKSALALEIARRLDGEIVNADAFQLYRGLEMLTAAPTAAEQALVPHHLFGVFDPTASCDAMQYRTLALPLIQDLISRGKTPVITGGSGLYLKFLSHGPSPLPPGDAALRAELDQLSLDSLTARLRELDPVEAARTATGNRRYLTRAIEICEISGRPCSEQRDQWRTASRLQENQLRGIVIQRSRDDLHRRIAHRTRTMLESGAIAEVAALPAPSDTLAKAIGFREIRNLIAGSIDRSTCADLIMAATRQYAKRQETWFRRETWLTPLPWPADSALPDLSNKF